MFKNFFHHSFILHKILYLIQTFFTFFEAMVTKISSKEKKTKHNFIVQWWKKNHYSFHKHSIFPEVQFMIPSNVRRNFVVFRIVQEVENLWLYAQLQTKKKLGNELQEIQKGQWGEWLNQWILSRIDFGKL